MYLIRKSPKYKARLVSKGFKQEHEVNYDKIFSSSQDVHPYAPTRGRRERRPRATATGRQDGFPTRRLRRRQLHVSTHMLQSDGGGISPPMWTEEKPLRLKTSVEDVRSSTPTSGSLATTGPTRTHVCIVDNWPTSPGYIWSYTSTTCSL